MTTVKIPASVVKDADKFASRNELRLAMTWIQIRYLPGIGVDVTATDAHALYNWHDDSQKFDAPFEFFIEARGLKIGAKDPEFEFEIIDGEAREANERIWTHAAAKAFSNRTNKPYNLATIRQKWEDDPKSEDGSKSQNRYPGWESVIPTPTPHDKIYEFQANDLAETLERIRRCANQTTNQIEFNFPAGELYACDLDFNIEARAAMPGTRPGDTEKMDFGALIAQRALFPFRGVEVEMAIQKPSQGVVIRSPYASHREIFTLLMPIVMPE